MCPIVVEVTDGRLTKVSGDRENPVYAGYTCVKGREMPSFVNSPNRLLHSLRRAPSGALEAIPVERALDEISQQLQAIIDEHGPRSVALYTGTQSQDPAAIPLATSLMDGIGSPMKFGALTLDKPGRTIAWAMLGTWMAPHQNFHDTRVAMMIGINPFVNGLGGLPLGHPSRWLSERLGAGMSLIVIDPRRSDTAKRASIFLQPRPGHDVRILAAMLRVIIAEGRYDRDFVAENVTGLEELRHCVNRFDPGQVADQADIDADDLIRAARTFAGAGRGFAVAGTGPHMAASSTLLEYLSLCLDTICGHWMQAGEVVNSSAVLASPLQPKAQAMPPRPAYGFGEPSRVRGLGCSAAGMPSASLSDEILLPGEGRVRALICCGGNPVAAIPDQLKTVRAMQSLDLLVQIDPWMSHTAEYASYVIAPKMPIEMAATTLKIEGIMRSTYATAYGYLEDYAQYAPAVVDPPEGSEAIEDWEFFYGLGQRLGVALSIKDVLGTPVPLDMDHKPTQDDLIEAMCRGSRVPLDLVKAKPHGDVFPADPPVVVASKDPGWVGRLDVGNEDMAADLTALAAATPREDDEFGYRLIVRRMIHVVNSSYNTGKAHGGHNPAFIHPSDLEQLGVCSGELVEIRSRHGTVPAVAEADPALRRGTVSMMFAFGRGPDQDHLVRQIGTSLARLLRNDEEFERYSGQPRMSGIPVSVRRLPDDG